MSSLFLMITITDRRSTDGFLQLYKSHGVTVSMRTVGSGTAVQETLSTLGLEKTEKAVLLAVVTAESWQKIQKDLRRKMQIDVPGTGIAFIVPLSSIGGKRALMFLTEHAMNCCWWWQIRATPAPLWTLPAPPVQAAVR